MGLPLPAARVTARRVPALPTRPALSALSAKPTAAPRSPPLRHGYNTPLEKRIGQHPFARPMSPPPNCSHAAASQSRFIERTERTRPSKTRSRNHIRQVYPSGSIAEVFFLRDVTRGCGSEAQTSEPVRSSAHTFHVNGWDTGIRSRVGQGKAPYLERLESLEKIFRRFLGSDTAAVPLLKTPSRRVKRKYLLPQRECQAAAKHRSVHQNSPSAR